MRTATAALKALISAGNQQWVKADLYTFYDASGAVLGRYTNIDQDITVNSDGTAGGPTYLSSGPLLSRGPVRTVIGIEVSSLDVTVSADSSKLLAGRPWLQALRQGVLDGGRCRLDRFMSDSLANVSVGTVYWFGGRIGPIVGLGRSSATIKVLSDLNLLNIQMPREIYQPTCGNTLYDIKCTVLKATFKVSNAVAAGSSLGSINCALAQSSGWFDLGFVKFTSGANLNVMRNIKKYSPGVLVLGVPLFTACANGDTFDVYPGCDKTQATCLAKFNNIANFRGMPYIPPPETAL